MGIISNVEFMLLQLIAECGQASGYDIKKLVDQRGYRDWTNIGTTSIYAGLKKLGDKGWIVSEEPLRKFGKGPLPVCFSLTDAGVAKLKEETISSLSSTRERDSRFDLGLATMAHIGKDEAISALRTRLAFLEQASVKVKEKYEAQGSAHLPLNIRALFLHPLSLIESEQAFVARLINELLEESEIWKQ